jgi:hypothetical protein
MGWERRGSKKYFYKKERTDGKVRSIYVKSREIANMISQLQSSMPLVEKFARLLNSSDLRNHNRAELALDELCNSVTLVTEGALLVSGFHTHKRQWRKKRNG